MMLHQQNADLIEAAAYRHDLSKHFLAVAAAIQHALQALNLPLDPPQPRRDAPIQVVHRRNFFLYV
jgi:hypothetical protein